MLCKLKKCICGLKPSSRRWNQALDKHLRKIRFKISTKDPFIYTLTSWGEVFLPAAYVYDVIVVDIQLIIKEIAERFDVKDMGIPHYFLEVK